MKNVLYVDVLVLLNIYISYFLFLSAKKLLNLTVSRARLLLGCLCAGAFSLIILFECNLFELISIKLAMGFILSFIVFYKGKWRIFFKAMMLFFVVNFLFGGLMLCLWYFFTPPSMQLKNGIVYFNISSFTLVISTVIAYAAVVLFSSFMSKRNASHELYSVMLTYKGREIMLTAFLDTGNKLVDSFTGLPVMICELSSLKYFLPIGLFEYFNDKNKSSDQSGSECFTKNKLRIIPIKTIGGESCLLAFKPQKISIKKISSNDDDEHEHCCEAFVAVTKEKLSDGSFQALLSTSLC